MNDGARQASEQLWHEQLLRRLGRITALLEVLASRIRVGGASEEPNVPTTRIPELGDWPAPVVTWPACNHCYCIDAGWSPCRSRPHVRCCKCGDVRLKSGMTW
jgi:hypothetical protein